MQSDCENIACEYNDTIFPGIYRANMFQYCSWVSYSYQIIISGTFGWQSNLVPK